MRAERDVDIAVFEQQAGPVQLHQWIKAYDSADAGVAVALGGGGYLDRAAGPLASGGYIEGVKLLVVACRILALGYDVERAAGRVNDRRRGYTDFGRQVRVFLGDIRAGNRIAKTNLPNRTLSGGIVSIITVYAVVFRSYVDQIANANLGNIYTGYIERLGVDVAVRRSGEKLAERARTHVRSRQKSLVQIGPRAAGIIVLCEHSRAARERKRFTRVTCKGTCVCPLAWS